MRDAPACLHQRCHTTQEHREPGYHRLSTKINMAKPAVSKKSAKAAAKGPVKKKRAKKDKNAPKGAMSAFMQFSQKERPGVREENPDMKITEMSKVLGARWREMDEKQKAPYQKKADADKARYQKELAAYKAKKAAEGSEEEGSEEESD